jgi:hypothetical protein
MARSRAILRTLCSLPSIRFWLARFLTVKNVTLRRETIVIALALLLIAAAIPFAILETIEKGRVHLFPGQYMSLRILSKIPV